MSSLFETLVRGGEPEISKLVVARTQETVVLEFKTKASSKHGELEKEDRRNLSQALSGFSNSMGGVLVWGVKASKNEDKIDCAISPDPIAEIERFKSRVLSLCGDLLSPKNDQVFVELVRCDAKPESGYLVVRVERSERRPHRSEGPNDGRYYKRVGDSFYPMEHYDIEDMFKRQVTASLALVHDFYETGRSGSERRFALRFGLRNEGTVTARFPYLSVVECSDCRVDAYGLDGNYNTGLPRVPSQTQTRAHFAGGVDHVINPGQTLDVMRFRIEIEVVGPPPGIAPLAQLPLPKVSVAYGCENLPITTKLIEVPKDDIHRLLTAGRA